MASDTDTFYRTNAPGVISETLDGEAVIMDLRSGTYFSTNGIGAVVWNWLETGTTQNGITASLAALPVDDPSRIADDVATLFAELLRHQLIVVDPGTTDLPAPHSVPDGLTYTPPALAIYTDLDDLLQLDPVHDVDAESGWPVPRPDAADQTP